MRIDCSWVWYKYVCEPLIRSLECTKQPRNQITGSSYTLNFNRVAQFVSKLKRVLCRARTRSFAQVDNEWYFSRLNTFVPCALCAHLLHISTHQRIEAHTVSNTTVFSTFNKTILDVCCMAHDLLLPYIVLVLLYVSCECFVGIIWLPVSHALI